MSLKGKQEHICVEGVGVRKIYYCMSALNCGREQTQPIARHSIEALDRMFFSSSTTYSPLEYQKESLCIASVMRAR